MTEVACPVSTCTYNLNRSCTLDSISLKFRAALDFPNSGTIVYLECCQQELPQDKEDNK